MKTKYTAAGTLLAFLFICLTHTESAKAQEATLLAPAEVDPEEVRGQLNWMGYYDTARHEYFSMITSNAITRFQKDFGLPPTGVAGPRTLAMLDNVEMMARIVHGEARGEHYLGQVAVAAVVLNRVEAEGFPNTIAQVILQRNAFTAVHDGQYDLLPNEEAYRAVRDAWTGADPSRGAVYYYNPDGVTDSWIYSRSVLTKIGRHYFAE